MADPDYTHSIIAQEDAKARGLRHYFTGIPCKRGHISRRLVSCGQCCACQKDRMEWYRPAHKDKYRELDRRQKDKDREKLRERDKKRYWADPNRAVDRVKDYYQRNKELIKAKSRERTAKGRRFQDAQYIKSLHIARIRVKQWQLDNNEQYRAHVRNTKAKRKHVNGIHTGRDIKAIFSSQCGNALTAESN